MDNRGPRAQDIWLQTATLVIALVLGPGGCGTPNVGRESAGKTDPGMVQSKPLAHLLDSIARHASNGRFVGTISMSLADTVILRKGYGVSARTASGPNNTETLFDISPLTRTFTAIAILQLVDAHQISLKDKISMFFEAVADDKTDITVAHLLAHTSGLSDVNDREFEPGMSSDEITTRVFKRKLQHKPGAHFLFARVNDMLAAQIVTLKSGLSWSDYLRMHVLKPAGMLSTGFIRDSITGARVTDSGISTDARTSGLVSTVTDLERLGRAVVSGTIITPSSFRMLFGARLLTESERPGAYIDLGECSVSYFGWSCNDSDGLRFYETSGSLDRGQSALFRWEPIRQLQIIILSNGDAPLVNQSGIREALLNELRTATIQWKE